MMTSTELTPVSSRQAVPLGFTRLQFEALLTAARQSPNPGVDLRDVQIAARHPDPRTTMRYDRARQNPDRQPNYILAAFMASGA